MNSSYMVVSQKLGTPNKDLNILSPYNEDLQKGTPNFGKAPHAFKQQFPYSKLLTQCPVGERVPSVHITSKRGRPDELVLPPGLQLDSFSRRYYYYSILGLYWNNGK